jgi:hypothetical protein
MWRLGDWVVLFAIATSAHAEAELGLREGEAVRLHESTESTMAAITAAAKEAANSGNMEAFNEITMTAQMSELVTSMFGDPDRGTLTSDHQTSMKTLDEKFACVSNFTSTTCRDSSSCGLVLGGIKCGSLPSWSVGSSLKRTFAYMPHTFAGRSLIMIGDNSMKSMVDVLDLAVREHAPGHWEKKVSLIATTSSCFAVCCVLRYSLLVYTSGTIKLSGPLRCHEWTETKFSLCYVSAARNGKRR